MTFSIFAVSFVVCSLMLMMRFWELKHKKALAHTRFFNKVDVVLESKLVIVRADVLRKKQEVVFFVTHHIPFYVWNKGRDLTSGLQKRYEKIERTVRGRNMIKQAGEVSPFIKNIKEKEEVL